MDFEEIEHRIATLALLGSKGTTGTVSYTHLERGPVYRLPKPARLEAADGAHRGERMHRAV